MSKILQIAGAAATVVVMVFVTGAFGSASAGRDHLAAAAAWTRAAGSPAGVARALPGQPIVLAPAPGHGAPAGRTGAGSPAASRAAVHSVNWAGYAATRKGKSFRFVQATFFVPFVNCQVSPHTFSADWIGLDGFFGKSPDSVEQDGIEADCQGKAGTTPRYLAWYETFPKPETPVSIKVSGGDSITASVSFSPASKRFRLSLIDNTSGQRISLARACPAKTSCPRTSAEVISEAPSNSRRELLPLADYGAVSFTNIAITGRADQRGGLVSGHWLTSKILQYGDSSRKQIARPTAVQSSGFANYWLGEI